MALNFKERELVTVGASVAAGCKPCTNYHFKKVREAGSSDEEIKQAIQVSVSVHESTRRIMEDNALKHLGIILDTDKSGCDEKTTRIKELVSIAAAFVVNCTSNLEKHIAISQNVGISVNEVKSVLDLALFVKEQAFSHVDRIAKRIGNIVSLMEKKEKSGGCCNDLSEVENTGLKKAIVTTTTPVEKEDCGCGGVCEEGDHSTV